MKMDFIGRWKQEYPVLKDRLFAFLDGLSRSSKQSLDPLSAELDKMVFEEIDCLDCANCCITTPALLTRKDIKRISSFLKTPPKSFLKSYVLEDINGELSLKNVPCVFLKEDNSCSIYEIRPNSCRDYPHTGSGSFKKRIKIHKENLGICPAAFEIIKRMERKLR